jgi:deoxyribonuclease-4
MRLGVHAPIAGGLDRAVEWAQHLGCSALQIFSRSPRGGPAPRRSAEELCAFDVARRAAGLEPLVIHAPYIINLAAPVAGTWRASLRLFQEEGARAAALGADFVVMHVGSDRGSGHDAGIRRVAEALDQTTPGLAAAVTVLLENTAGSGGGLGSAFEHLAAIRSRLTQPERVGVCLDTAHLFAAGHPIHTAEGLEEVLRAFERTVGLGVLRLLHLNDSKVPFGARVDRHWHIGQGHIGEAAFRRLLRHPRLRILPGILETPKTTEAEDRRNLAVVRRLMGSDGRLPRPRRVPARSG